MHLKHLLSGIWLASACTASSSFSFPSFQPYDSFHYAGLHAASVEGLLQVPPSFADDSIAMHPALNPNHDSDDLFHLNPVPSKELYYSQEGHRPAIHGAKHARAHLTFSRPTVILDHSSHIKSVRCEDDELITICFKSELAMQRAVEMWQTPSLGGTFNLATYHPGCGDNTGKKRSFFEASMPLFDHISSSKPDIHSITIQVNFRNEAFLPPSGATVRRGQQMVQKGS